MLGRLFKNEDGAGHVRQALDLRISPLRRRALILEGRDEFPPRTRLLTEQILHLVKPGTLVGNQLRDFILQWSFHRHRPFMVIAARHGGQISHWLRASCSSAQVASASWRGG